MTLLLAVNYELFGIVIADSRATLRGVGYKDSLQKVNLYTSAGLIGWAGDMRLAGHLMNQVFAPIARAGDDPWSVLDETRMREALSADHLVRSAPRGTAHFVFSLIKPLAYAWGNIPQAIQMAALTVRKDASSWDVLHDLMALGETRIFGTGDAVAPELAALDVGARVLAQVAGGQISEKAVASRCIALEQMISGKIGSGIPSVGGLLQLQYMLNDRARFLSYEKWVDCGGGYGTYVTYDIEEGAPVQLHRPTGLRVPIYNPFSQPDEIVRSRSDFLAKVRELRRSDPGVERHRGQPASRYLFQHGPRLGPSTYRPLIFPGAR